MEMALELNDGSAVRRIAALLADVALALSYVNAESLQLQEALEQSQDHHSALRRERCVEK